MLVQVPKGIKKERKKDDNVNKAELHFPSQVKWAQQEAYDHGMLD